MLDPDGMEAQLVPDHPGPWPLWDQLRLFARIIWNIPVFYRARPSVVTPRVAQVYSKLPPHDFYLLFSSSSKPSVSRIDTTDLALLGTSAMLSV